MSQDKPDATPAVRTSNQSFFFQSDIFSAGRLIARRARPGGVVEEPARVTPAQMDRWAGTVDSWDVCDQACQNLFRYTPFAFDKAAEWARARPEFVRRAGFSLMAGLAVKAKDAPDARFEEFLPLIAEPAADQRNMVKKAVNWALRQIGKRNSHLCRAAIRTAEEIARQDSPSARWIARDALRELRRL